MLCIRHTIQCPNYNSLIILTIYRRSDILQVDVDAGNGVMLISEGHNAQGATVHVVRRVDNAVIIGRRFGPFREDARPVDLSRLWSMFEEQISVMDDLNSRLVAAMALRCPKMRQRALENILLSGAPMLLPEPNSFTDSTSDSDAGSWVTAVNEDPSTFTTTEPAILEEPLRTDAMVEWESEDDEDEEVLMNKNYDNNDWEENDEEDDDDWDEDSDDEDFDDDKEDEFDDDEDEEDEDDMHHHMHMGGMMHIHHLGRRDNMHHHHGGEYHSHHNMKHGPRGPMHGFMPHHPHGGPFNIDGRRPMPMPRGGLDHPDRRPIIHFKALGMPFTNAHQGDSEREQLPMDNDMGALMEKMMDRFMHHQREGDKNNNGDMVMEVVNPRPQEETVNWGLWNEDGSLNGGLVLFAGLCAACAAVWSALLMQCTGVCRQVCGGSAPAGPQFIMLPAYDSEEEEEEDPKLALKRQEKQNGGVIIAAEYVTKP